MTTREERTYLHLLDKKIKNFKGKLPLYCQIMVLYDEKQIYVSVPDFLDSTMRFDIDFSLDPSRAVRMVQEAIVRFFPVLEREDGRRFYIDKVNFRSNCFVVKYEGCPSGWSAIYKMKKPVFVLLKETFQSKKTSPAEKEKVFNRNIKELMSQEDYRNVL